jgi:hypothetical protein
MRSHRIKGPKHVVVKFIVHQSVLINSSCVLTVDLYHIICYRNKTGMSHLKECTR